jgi:respiratory nitrate reductase gamma subunit
MTEIAPGQMDQWLFAVLPYVVVVFFVVLFAARRYRLPPYSQSAPSAAPRAGWSSAVERSLLGYGMLVVLGGHVLAFLVPEQVISWDRDQVRLYLLEGSGMAFALMTLIGLVLALFRRLGSSAARAGMGIFDWLFLLLLLGVVTNGILVALFRPWGSAWGAASLTPYLRSLFRLDPDVRFVKDLGAPIKLHVVLGFLLIGLFPLTRLIVPFLGREWERERERVAAGKIVTAALVLGLGFSLLALGARLQGSHLPGNDQGYEPRQPIVFSHRLHAGDMQMSCLYCHSGADKSRFASVPAASVCMNCHRFVTAPISAVRAEYELARQEKRPAAVLVSPELAKLYAALGLDEKMQPDPKKRPVPIRWIKVDNLPAFTCFDHHSHVNAGVACQVCHGRVETMERTRQVEDFSMGWCVNCHRQSERTGVAGKEVRPSTDCATCHH